MKWNNVISLMLFAYLTSMNVFAQVPANGMQTPNNGQQVPTQTDSLNIVDDGGSLKFAPSGAQQSVPSQSQQLRRQPQGLPSGQQPSDSADIAPGSPPGGIVSGPPAGEMEESSSPNQGMVPQMPSQQSIPEPDRGSMQN